MSSFTLTLVHYRQMSTVCFVDVVVQGIPTLLDNYCTAKLTAIALMPTVPHLYIMPCMPTLWCVVCVMSAEFGKTYSKDWSSLFPAHHRICSVS